MSFCIQRIFLLCTGFLVNRSFLHQFKNVVSFSVLSVLMSDLQSFEINFFKDNVLVSSDYFMIFFSSSLHF